VASGKEKGEGATFPFLNTKKAIHELHELFRVFGGSLLF